MAANRLPDPVRLYERRVVAVDSAPSERVSPCPVCDEELARPCFEIEDFASRVIECTGCGLGRVHPVPGPEELRALYPDNYYGEPGTKFQPLVERAVRVVGERHIGFLSRGLAPGARVLDVGCGRGVILGALADRGFEVHGVEISPEAARGADPRAEIRIASKLSEAGYPDATFDEVIVWHVLEHLSDPRGTLEEIHRVLAPGGRLIVAVPNFSSAQARWTGAAWFHLDLPRHVYHFPLAALERLIERAGFEVGRAYHFSLRQNPFGWIQSVSNMIPGLPRNGLYTLLHRRTAAGAVPFGPVTRVLLWAWLVVSAGPAIAASFLETACRTGATVHVVAKRPR